MSIASIGGGIRLRLRLSFICLMTGRCPLLNKPKSFNVSLTVGQALFYIKSRPVAAGRRKGRRG